MSKRIFSILLVVITFYIPLPNKLKHDKMKHDKPKCKYCGKEYDPKEIDRIYGKESSVKILGYCSAGHYTRDVIINQSK